MNNHLTHIRPEILVMGAYHVPNASGLIKLDAMENPYTLPEDLKAQLATHLAQVALNRYPVPSYTVLDLFASYRVNKNMDVRLNVGNVTDKDYYLAAYRSGSFLYMGDARNARVTLNYDF